MSDPDTAPDASRPNPQPPPFDPDAMGNYVDDDESPEVPEPNEPA